MQLTASYKKHLLQFSFDAGTSRGIMKDHDTWFLKISDKDNPDFFGVGEAAPLPGLSCDPADSFEEKLYETCDKLSELTSADVSDPQFIREMELDDYPSIKFAVETAALDLLNGGRRLLCDSPFYSGKRGITINGLIWMGDKDSMLGQVRKKIEAGFTCIKMKIGAISFPDELEVIRAVRKEFSADEVVIRVDANGAFTVPEAIEKLKVLAELDVDSIEQPVKAGNYKGMAEVCEKAAIPVALDEELIGIKSFSDKKRLLDILKPHSLVLKPTLLGGFVSCKEWISLAGKYNISWWLTSALESNVGLNAIAQFADGFSTSLPQGLGTGQLYTNNIKSPLVIKGEKLWYDRNEKWELIF